MKKINFLIILMLSVGIIFIIYKSNISYKKINLVGESAIYYAQKEYPTVDFSVAGINYNRGPQTYSVTLVNNDKNSNLVSINCQVSQYKDENGFFTTILNGGLFRGSSE